MIRWDYRVVRHVEEGDEWYAIHEVYYEKDGVSATENAIPVGGTTIDELREDFKKQAHALDLPVMNYTDFDA